MVSPLSALPVVGGLAAGLIPLIAAKKGVGKNTTNVTDFGRTSQYDPNKFQYGGRAGAADETAGRFNNLAAGAQGRNGEQANYGRANDWEQQALAARAEQGQIANLMHQRATGATPSIAGQQAALDMQRATAAQASAGASARGAGGMALAQQNAAGNTAMMQSNISNQAQINAANERMQAEQAAFGAYSGMRGGDQAGQGIATQQAQYNAGLQAQQRAQNDAYSMGLYGQEANVRNAQLTAGMNEQGLLANSFQQSQGQRIGVGQANADLQMKYYDQFGKALTGAASGATQLGLAGGGQPNTGLAAPSATGLGSAGGAQTGMVGIPQPGTGSDDQMKFGMSPLSGLLGMGGGGGSSSPGGTVDIGGKGYMSSSDIQRASTGTEGQTMPGMVGGGGVTGGNMGNLGMPQGGGMGGGGGFLGGLLSDDQAKLRATYLQGRADAEGPSAYPNLRNDERLVVSKDGAHVRDASPFAGARGSATGRADYETSAAYSDAAAREDEWLGPNLSAASYALGPAPAALSSGAAVLNRGQAMGERYASRSAQGEGRLVQRDRGYDDERRAAESYGGADSMRRYPGAPADPVTEQFARGLAPIRFEYKPGMGPGGQQTGVRAQQAETQPVTASMITRRPDGLRQIDPAMGLGTALAGVGHLAQKQQDQEARLDQLLRRASIAERGY